MKNFQSSLIIQTSASSDFSLPKTAGIRTCPSPFAISPRQDYLYTYDGSISIYTVAPFNMVKKTEYKTEIKDLLLTSTALFLLNDNTLIMHSKSSFHTLSGSFQESKLLDICMDAPDSKDVVGVQSPSTLTVYDGSFRQTAMHRCQCSYSARNILLLGDFNMLVIIVNGKRTMEIAMPDRITALACDQLFSKVFCACLNGEIYAVSMEGEPMQKMEYHKASVFKLKMSFCGNYLYSADPSMVCVWSASNHVVMGFFEADKPIQGFDLVLEGNRIYEDVPISLR